jgi:RimJ/RimL family protein N-acetyltransferase
MSAPSHHPRHLDTTRLTLHPWSPAQILTLIDEPDQFAERAGFTLAAGLRDSFIGPEVSPAWVAALRAASGPDPWLGFFAVPRESNVIIGTIGFTGPPTAEGVVEVAYGFAPAFQGQGYATEATAAVTAFALGAPGVQRVRAHTLPEANASTRVLTKCGFQRVDEVIDPQDGLIWRWERRVS